MLFFIPMRFNSHHVCPRERVQKSGCPTFCRWVDGLCCFYSRKNYSGWAAGQSKNGCADGKKCRLLRLAGDGGRGQGTTGHDNDHRTVGKLLNKNTFLLFYLRGILRKIFQGRDNYPISASEWRII